MCKVFTIKEDQNAMYFKGSSFHSKDGNHSQTIKISGRETLVSCGIQLDQKIQFAIT